MNRRKILFASRLYLPHIGGVELHLQQLNRFLTKENQVTVVTEQHDESLPLEEDMDDVRVLRIPLRSGKNKKIQIWFWWLLHLRLIFESNLIHIHDVFFWFLPFRPLFFWKKFYITFHGYEGTQNPNWKKKFWHQLAEICTQGNICVGGFHQKWYDVTPTQLSFGAADSKRLSAGIQKIIESKIKKNVLAEKSELRFVFVGRLAEDTGILTYIDALGVLKNSLKLTLDVYGDGPQLQLAKEYADAYQLKANFHGAVPNESIVWTDYDLGFVSRYLSIIECASSGLPIVAQCNCGIKKDYLGESSFSNWIEVGQSTEDVVNAVKKWMSLSDEEYQQKVTSIHSWATEQGWEKVVSQYKDLWNTV